MKKAILIFVILLSLRASASHIVGGEIMYRYISNTSTTVSYEITMYLYIDCFNGFKDAIAQDPQGYFNVFSFDKSSNTYSQYTNGGMFYQLLDARTGPVRVSDVNYNCIRTTPSACVDKYTFTKTITVPINQDGYVVSYERCCRNKTILNIVSPESSGATYWTQIPGFRTVGVNHSPVFKGLPPNFLCINAPLNYDHSATDADGDSLVYTLYDPFLGASQNSPIPQAMDATNPADLINITWQGGYGTPAKQIDGSPTLTINSKTGKINLTPTLEGQFVIGIKVLEYRKGVLIGETKRDFQFNVSQCVFDIVASFFVPQVNCQGNDVFFNNRSQNSTNYSWDFGDPESTDDTSNQKTPIFAYKKPGKYNIKLKVSNAGLCKDSTEYEVTVKENFKVTLPKDTLYCGPFSRSLKCDVSNKKYLWNTGATTQAITVSKEGLYWVKATESPCTASDSMFIYNDLSQVDIGPDSVICRDSFVQFTYKVKPGYKTYLWNDSTDQSSVFVSKLGTYWVATTNSNNCPSSDTITFVLYPPPRTFMNDTLFCKGTTVDLDGSNISIKTKLETNYLWSTGEKTPKITTGVPGIYMVKVRNKLCTIYDTVDIRHIETNLDLGQDTFYCGPVDRWLRPLKTYSKYLWHDFAEVVDYHATTPGKKKLTITTKEGCVESDSVFITQYPAIDGGLGNDTVICLSSTIHLIAKDSFVSYLWNTGSKERQIDVRDSGIYIVTVMDKYGCIVSDSIRIREQSDALPVDLFMPNAFSPNGDFLNEFYPGNKYKDPGSPYLMRIYDRWGEKIFESQSPVVEWNGTVNEKPAPQDVYVYYVKYVGCDNVERWFRGTFTLLK